jgi:hypothetical protein
MLAGTDPREASMDPEHGPEGRDAKAPRPPLALVILYLIILVWAALAWLWPS